MASLSLAAKYSFRYSSTADEENSARTISGLNFYNNVAGGGTTFEAGLTRLVTTINSLSTGTITNARLVTEQEVTP